MVGNAADGFRDFRGGVISICAGVTIDTLSQYFREYTNIFRVMPNTSCLIGQSASAFCCKIEGNKYEPAVKRLLGACGVVEKVSEKQMDAVTGVSGSGPAYVYMLVEALSDAGVKHGLPRAVATRLAAQTVAGSGRMVLEGGLHPAVLRDQVTSPGGTTIAGVAALEEKGFKAAVHAAVAAATSRSIELGKAKH
eukprot:GHVT01023052.1.p2 GENE.GHVT01023052.1~~GHVT01023052.1.p2  ORF type:complete len:194 (-),score=42.02 GHVT01023052.1:131-712(-)